MSLRPFADRTLSLLRNPLIKRYVVVLILVLTTLFFVAFFAQHPEYLNQLGDISPWTILWVLLLNALMIVLLVLICIATLALCGKKISLKENFLLTAYSSIANFFGPLQSGPGVRAVYLKSRHQVRLRDYTLASLLLLGMFAFFSALFLLVGTLPWRQTALALLAVAAISTLVIRLFMKRDKRPADSQFALRPGSIAALIILSFLQACVAAAWYYVELHAVNPHIHLSQAISYTGAANFSLFVSITPDAVGIRETFLVFSQHIHHVSTGDIVSANVIDRVAYVLFLGILFIIVLATHAKATLRITSLNLKRVVAKSGRSPK